MWTPIGSGELFSEANLFTQGAMAGDLAFVARDDRVASSEPADPSVEAHARRTLANLGVDLKTAGLDLESIVSLMVYLPATKAPALSRKFWPTLLARTAGILRRSVSSVSRASKRVAALG
jgi:enamine deaminase RidA (YjgF/YER057c/UK114 family)